MARRVDARRRWVELPTQVVLRLLFRRVWLRRRRQAQLPTCQRDVHRSGRVWTVCTVVEPWSSCCQRCPAVGVCLPGCRVALS